MSFDITLLITNRAKEDVDRVKELVSKGYDAMSDAEKAEWNGEMKGAYNASDLNRVGLAVDYLTRRLRSYGISAATAPKTDWTVDDAPTISQMRQYLADVEALRSAIAVLQTTPVVPSDMEGLTYTEANDIEKILTDIDRLITNMTAAWFYSGDIYSGEV